MPGLAVFDVDHTITRHSTGRRLVQCGLRARVFRVTELLALPYHYLRYRAGKVDVDRAIRSIARLKGRSLAELQQLALTCFETRVRADIMAEARTCIQAHARAGDTLAIATSSLGLIVRPLAQELQVANVLATELAFEEGIATGALATKPCFGEEKRDRVLSLAKALGVPSSAVTFYSDSHLDLPLLREVGNPVVVNPDRRLLAEARQRGWDIASFT